MLHHQIALSETHEGLDTLNQLEIERVKTEIIVQGYLFYPISHDCPTPINGSPLHLKGSWLPISRLESWLQQHTIENRYVLLPKALWLSAYSGCIITEQPFTRQKLTEHLQIQLCKQAQPRLIACCQPISGKLQETARFFVVPDDWEASAKMVAEMK
jgi:hypothetical protein